jgi:ubiquinone/menaquinone biosynthesis C-methylase UbiE
MYDSAVNAEVIEAWNSVLFDKFYRFRHIVVHGLARHADVALQRHPPRPGTRVLDVGCGFGDTTVQLAGLVGPAGQVVGIDAAPRFVETARREAAGAGAVNARFAVADIQTDPLGGPYELAFSRFGTMFLRGPIAALRNIRSALVPGGKLVMIMWRDREENVFLHTAEQCVRHLFPRAPDTDQPSRNPGPFSMTDADTLSAQLMAASYDQICLERCDLEFRFGRDLDEAIDFAMSLGPAGEIVRRAGEAGRRRLPEVTAALRRGLAPFARPDGVYGPSSTWIVSAHAP